MALAKRVFLSGRTGLGSHIYILDLYTMMLKRSVIIFKFMWLNDVYTTS